MKNLFTWIIILLLTGTIVTCTPDIDDREPERIISDWSGFYSDTISLFHPTVGYIYNDSIVVKQIVRINDSTYKMCGAVCPGLPFLSIDSIMFTIHYTNDITPVFINNTNPQPLPIASGSYAIPGSNYIYLRYPFSGRLLIERLKKM